MARNHPGCDVGPIVVEQVIHFIDPNSVHQVGARVS